MREILQSSFGRFARISVGAASLLIVAASQLSAQKSLPFSEDALVLGFGQVRTGVHGRWEFYDQVYTDAGTLVPFGSSLSFQAAGATEFQALAGNEASIRFLTGQNSFSLSLGSTEVNAVQRRASTSLVMDIGLPGRFMLSAELPLVRVETTTGIRANADVNSANVGLNPAATSASAFAADTSLANQITRARNTLNAQLAACLGSTAPECASLNARRTEAQTLATTSGTISAGIMGLASSQFAPLASSAAFATITSRIATLKNAYSGFGINSITGASISPATLPVSAAQFRDFLASSNGGNASLPSYRSVTRLGDVSVTAKFKIAERERFRGAAFGRVFFPTGGKTSSAELFPLAAGDGTTRTEAGGMGDLFIGKRISVTASGAAAIWMATDVTTRVTLPGETGPGTAALARRGSRSGFTLSITPRYAVNRWATLGATYQSTRLSAEEFSLENAGAISTWNAQRALTDHRVGAGISFSNLASSRSAGPRFPVEASFYHAQSIGGSGGQPKIFSDEIRIRIFARK